MGCCSSLCLLSGGCTCRSMDLHMTPDEESAFARPIHAISQRTFTIWRALGTFAWLVMSGVQIGFFIQKGTIEFFPIFLTHWMLIAQLVYLFLATYCSYLVLQAAPTASGEQRPSRIHGKSPIVTLTWFLQGVVETGALVVSVLYYALLFGSTNTARTILVHTISSIIILIDICLSGSPHRLAHVWQPLLLAFLYSLFTLLYALAGGRSDTRDVFIYSVLNWEENPSKAGVYAFGVTFIVCPFFFILCWLLWATSNLIAGGPALPAKDRQAGSVMQENVNTSLRSSVEFV
eukprot:gb/GEZN01012465.1/.p1 GENE.gb/GEZN01012465.1/~~gb/GEZN01012465.1/.p1  ORF type:complete len:290 (-),score=6.52 gb/GEZN01012465.1/:177-1046(-)